MRNAITTMPTNCNLSCDQFTNFLVRQEPIYDKEIIKDIRPEDGWIGHVASGLWPAFNGTQHTKDRFRSVFPNVTKPWQDVDADSCAGAPCNPPSTEVGWGYERKVYNLQRKRVKTKLLCYDQIIHVNKAKEHFRQIISDILRPTTSWVSSHYLRTNALRIAGKAWLADAAMTDFTHSWSQDADGNEVILNTSGDPTSKITPQMLQRRVHPLMLSGYFGKNPFKDMPPLIELVTDMETIWDLDKAICNSTLAGQWRFQDWGAQNKYWKYAFTGQLGNYAIRGDPFPLRFQQQRAGSYRLVLPYVNSATTVGIGSLPNDDFQTAQYQMSFIMHRMGFRMLVQKMEAVNPEMPFAVRDLGGRWRFALDNLGSDENGCVIENIARNKGLFFADFEYATEPLYVEFVEAIFHKREPACITTCDTCNADPGYTTQDYDSANGSCTHDDLTFTVSDTVDAPYQVTQVTCNGVPVNPAAIPSASLASVAAIVDFLNTNFDTFGTWTSSGNVITLAGSTCSCVTVEIDTYVAP